MTDLRATSLTRPTIRLSTPEPAQWRLDAACRGWDHELQGDPWHPVSDLPAAYDQARRICDACPVVVPCLAEANAAESGGPGALRFGMYGGRTPTERAAAAAGPTGRDRPPTHVAQDGEPAPRSAA
ncbi:WhiB family transcriptional regulator [Oerskovia sp. NPDC057915]|uniref:WhiB family transcriptional regulator n=1 Tax=Oerskovia sp. NPDC057915 TaxID=3346280 RepID=UPI0036D7E6B4